MIIFVGLKIFSPYCPGYFAMKIKINHHSLCWFTYCLTFDMETLTSCPPISKILNIFILCVKNPVL